MIKLLKRIALIVGIDKAIIYTSSAKIIQALGGIVSVLMIAKFLTGAEQGFYYTFASILAIQVFFELGLNGIITQYVAHEAVYLKLHNECYIGSEKHLSRMASLLHFCIKWYVFFGWIFFGSVNYYWIYLFWTFL